MNLPVLALLTRSLRTEARSGWTYANRLALVLVIFFFLLLFSLTSRMMGTPGLALFTTIANIDLVFITLAAIGFFATCITEEKEEGTLGLLRMTDLSPVAIVLGKYGGRLLTAFLLILIQLPFTLLTITLGGVAPAQIEAAYVTLLAYMVLVAGVGLLISVFASCSRRAVMFTTALIFLYMMAAPLGFFLHFLLVYYGFLVEKGPADAQFMQAVLWIGKINVFEEMNQVVLKGANSFLVSTGAIVNATGGVACFFLAWLCFDLFNRNNAVAEPARAFSLPRARRRNARQAWPGVKAIVWKDLYFTAGGPQAFLILTAFFCLITAMLAYFIKRSDGTVTRQAMSSAMMLVFFWIGAIHLLILANRIFSEEVQGRTLSSLALLPYPLSRMAYAKVAGSLAGLAPVTLFFLVGVGLTPADNLVSFAKLFTLDPPPGWIILSEALFLIHLVVFLSLYIKWAAIPIALAVNFIGFVIFGFTINFVSTFARGMETVTLGFALVILLGAAAGLYIKIGYRLTQLARE